MYTRLLFVIGLGFATFSSGAMAQSCPENVAGESMARMIGEAGGASNLRDMANAQVAEIDTWLAGLEPSRGQGIREAEIEALRSQGLEMRAANVEIATAALCYM